MSKLRFTVVACSGEDPAFPAKELNEHAANSKGYVTPNFLTLKSNVESNYMARELKTVHIDNEATFVKMLLHQCYINERNIYSQVGVMAINLCGEPLGLLRDELPNQSTGELLNGTPSIRSNPKPSPKGAAGSDDLSFDLRFDAKTAARIREIQIVKDQAVAMEDYDQAKRLKQMEEQLKSIGLQFARLESQKRDAVANEDYDLAKRIKDEICMLEASVGSNKSQPIVPQPTLSYQSLSPSYSNNPRSQGASSMSSRSQVLPRAAAAIIGSKNVNSSSSFSPRDMYPYEHASGPKRGNSGGFSGDRNPSPTRPSSTSSRHALHADGDGEDDEEDPVGGGGDGGGPNPNFRGIPDAENLADPEEIPSALAKESEQLIGIIGPFFTRCFYSNLWNHRDAAIRKVTMDLDSYRADPIQLLEVCSTLVQSGAGDRIAQVALSAFRLVERMLPFSSRIRRDDMFHILGNSMTQIVSKLGESQSKVRDEAAATLMRLASAKNVGVEFVVSHLTKRSKKPLGVKFLMGRLNVMKDLVARFELLPDSEHSVAGIMSFLEDSNCFSHQNKEIRDPAKELTVALHLIASTEVEGYLKSLRPKQLEEYQLAFEAAETARASNARSAAGNRSGNGSKATSGSGGGGSRQAASSRPQVALPDEMRHHNDDDFDDGEDNESVDEYTCPFCGIVDEKFDSDRLDHHFWAECRMLTPCKMCGQVIEIAGLNEHLLVECELRKNHKECPRCREAITAKFYDKHVGLDDCLPCRHPKKANRCSLCHEDIGPGKAGWREHLFEESCPNNPRN
ncbi:Centrosomal protein, partial [Globisporangium splendens]